MTERKQSLPGFEEYANELNDLSASQWMDFVFTAESLTAKRNDLVNYVDNEVRPVSVISEIVDFFTKKGASILDIFSGEGHNLTVYSESGRKALGVELDQSKIDHYRMTVQADSFLDEFQVMSGDALFVLKSMDFTTGYDFCLIDPPRKKFPSKCDILDNFSEDDYSSYLAEVVNLSAKLVKNGKFIALFVNDAYCKGRYVFMPPLISSKINPKLVELNGIKIYHQDLEKKILGAAQTYAPRINHFYLLIFKVIKENSNVEPTSGKGKLDKEANRGIKSEKESD